jgi:hypothetical protein
LKRVHQIILITSTIAISWLGMMIVHEAGHVIGAWSSGGTVSKVVLHPLQFSWTDVSHNPHPLWVVWAGPVFGVLAPLAAWGIAARFKAPFDYLLRFFAGFCLLANGAYLGLGVFDWVGDAGDLLALGASPWHLWLFGAVCIPIAFVFWHGLGPKFGLREARGRVNQRHAFVILGLLSAVVLVEVVVLIA